MPITSLSPASDINSLCVPGRGISWTGSCVETHEQKPYEWSPPHYKPPLSDFPTLFTSLLLMPLDWSS